MRLRILEFVQESLANLTSYIESQGIASEHRRSILCLAKDVADFQASHSYSLRIHKECELAGLKLPRMVLAEVVISRSSLAAAAISAVNSAAPVDCGIQLSLGHDDEITALQVTVGANLLKALLNDISGRDFVHHLGSLVDVKLSTDAKSTLEALLSLLIAISGRKTKCGAIGLLSSSDTAAVGTVPFQAKTSPLQRSVDTAKDITDIEDAV